MLSLVESSLFAIWAWCFDKAVLANKLNRNDIITRDRAYLIRLRNGVRLQGLLPKFKEQQAQGRA